MTRLLLLLKQRRSELGTSLVELVVVVGLLGVVLPTGYSAVASMQRQESMTTSRFAALGQAQVIMDRVGKDLRSAVAVTSGTGAAAVTAAFTAASAADISFYANLNKNGPVLLHAYVNTPVGGVANFHEDILAPDTPCTPPACSYTGVPSSRIDGQYVSTTAPIYVFYTNTGAVITAPVAAAQLASIDSVGITITAQVYPKSPSTTLTTLIHIRNVDYNPS